MVATTLNMTTLGIKWLFVTFSIKDSQHYNALPLCWVPFCWVLHLFIVMLNVIMLIVFKLNVMVLSIFQLNVIMLSVFQLNVIMLSVIAPNKCAWFNCQYFFTSLQHSHRDNRDTLLFSLLKGMAVTKTKITDGKCFISLATENKIKRNTFLRLRKITNIFFSFFSLFSFDGQLLISVQ